MLVCFVRVSRCSAMEVTYGGQSGERGEDDCGTHVDSFGVCLSWDKIGGQDRGRVWWLRWRDGLSGYLS